MSEADKIIKSLRDSGKKVEEFYMSNKTSDENVANDIKILKKFCEYEEAVVLTDNALEEVQDAMQNILAEREQDKKRIQELEKERDHWHGCFIVAMENSIAKEKVIEAFEDIEDYFDRLNGPDEDMDYIRQVKQELLEGEK